MNLADAKEKPLIRTKSFVVFITIMSIYVWFFVLSFIKDPVIYNHSRRALWSLGLLSFTFALFFERKKIFKSLLFKLSLLLSLTSLVQILFTPKDFEWVLLRPISCFGFYWGLKDKLTSKVTVWIFVIFLSILTLFALSQQVDPNNSPMYYSQNGLILYLFLALAIGIKHITPLRLIIISSMALGISLWTTGRMNIISSVSMFIMASFLWLNSSKKPMKKALIPLALASIAIVLFANLSIPRVIEDGSELISKTRAYQLERFVHEDSFSPRSNIWFSYFKNLGVKELILGGDSIRSDYMEQRFKYIPYKYNHHSSFIALHREGGLLSTIAVAAFFFYLLTTIKKKNIQNQGIALSILFAFALRCITDEFLFYDIGFLGLLILGHVIIYDNKSASEWS